MTQKRADLIDIDAETEVLGAVFVRPELLAEINLDAADFGVARHRLIWAGICDVRNSGLGVDLGSVRHAMQLAGTYERVGGIETLSRCLDRSGYSWNAVYYAGVVRQKALERRMLEVQGDLGKAIAQQDQEQVAQYLDALSALSRERAQMESDLQLRSVAEIQTCTGEDWLDQPPPEASTLLRMGKAPFMRDGRLALLVAASSTGKTFALVQLAVAVASGSAWLDTFSVERKGRVLLALGEEDTGEVRRRVYRATRHLDAYERSEVLRNLVPLGLEGTDVAFLRHGRDGNLTSTAWYESFRSMLSRAGDWRLIILDPWSRWGGPDAETDAHAATRGVQLLEALTKLPGAPAIVLAHHTRKPSMDRGHLDASDTRGSSALVDGARLVMQLMRRGKRGHRPSKLLEFGVTKANYTVIGESVVLTRGRDGTLRPASPSEIAEDSDTEKKA